MIWLELWEPVYYRKWNDKAGKVLMHPGRFEGLAWNVGNTMIFKVFQCNEDPHKQNIVLNRGVVVQFFTTAIGYNSDLCPKSDDYLPDFQVEGGTTSKTTPLGHPGERGSPCYCHTRGGRKAVKDFEFVYKHYVVGSIHHISN